MDEYDYLEKKEEEKLAALELTKEDVNSMRNYVSDYESLEKTLDRYYFSIEDADFKETVVEMQNILTEHEKRKYEDFMAKLDEYDCYDSNDYNDNDAIARDYKNEILGGLKNGV